MAIRPAYAGPTHGGDLWVSAQADIVAARP